jgi:ferredoxin
MIFAGVLSGAWNWKRIVSFFYLAVAFNVRQVRRLFRGRADDGGIDRFLENYAGEGMPLMAPDDLTLLVGVGRCIHCGLCEAACPEPVDRWTTWSRAIAMANEAVATIPADCPEGCVACTEICPTGVPLGEIPAFLHRRAGR